MNTIDFFDLLLDHIVLYLGGLGISVSVYFILFHRLCKSLLDPLFIALLGSCFSVSVVLFLFLTNSISTYYFLSFCLTQSAFIIGIYIFNIFFHTYRKKNRFHRFDNQLYLKSVFYFSLFVFIITNIIVYVKLGIPILLESRLNLTLNAGGWGILTRFTSVSASLLVYLFFYFKFIRKYHGISKFSIKLFLFLYLLTLVLSGAKSSIWSIFVLLYVFIIQFKNNSDVEKLSERIRHNSLKIVFVGLLFSVIILLLTFATNINQAFISLLMRFVGYGDIYWHAYPGGYIDDLSAEHPFYVIFGSFLGSMRIIDPAQIPEPLGYSLAKMFYTLDSMVGPNPRHNVFGYVYFGFYGSVLYSFILGGVLSWIRIHFFNSTNASVLFKMFIANLYIAATSIETAVDLFMHSIYNLLIIIPFLMIGGYILYIFGCIVKYPNIKAAFV